MKEPAYVEEPAALEDNDNESLFPVILPETYEEAYPYWSPIADESTTAAVETITAAGEVTAPVVTAPEAVMVTTAAVSQMHIGRAKGTKNKRPRLSYGKYEGMPKEKKREKQKNNKKNWDALRSV